MDSVAQEFEAQFLSQMLGTMFSGIETGGELGGGEAEETYRSMLIDEYGKLISRAGGVGVADHVKREMLRLQEVE
jgi:Rod binding domain-containing protein